ncbi:hypothetical protein [Neobacillus sp. YIM B06451]|uniref:hypothetical protein n=1 Tax=Neobacillus sp. YIM B06451 TaxID=3070994 RepID=UPI00292F5E47|nr:hypothetical protein [Neobacillus sp. YIM B06451]
MSEEKEVVIFTTNFDDLENEFNDIIYEIEDKSSTRFHKVKNIKFHDLNYVMTVDELLNKDSSIQEYHYDLYRKDDKGNRHLVFGFHKQSKTRDKRYRTNSDPYHIHLSKLIEFTTMDRLDNFHHEELPRIMELIRILFQFERYLLKRIEAEIPKKRKGNGKKHNN